jgi:hypothetical protein
MAGWQDFRVLDQDIFQNSGTVLKTEPTRCGNKPKRSSILADSLLVVADKLRRTLPRPHPLHSAECLQSIGGRVPSGLRPHAELTQGRDSGLITHSLSHGCGNSRYGCGSMRVEDCGT